MYFLVIKNLGVEKCIDINKDDIYENGQHYKCNLDLDFVKNRMVKNIRISCTGLPRSVINAIVYSDLNC